MTGPPGPKIHDAVRRRIRALGFPAGARVLDAPCGDGGLAVALAKEGWDVSGADLEQEGKAWPGEGFRTADLNQALPWPDASFDLVVSVEGLEHLENPFSFVREAHRVCRPGGTLLLTTPNTVSLRSRMRFFGSGFHNQDPRPLAESARHPLHHVSLRTFADLRYLLHTSGFRLIAAEHTHTKPVSYLYAIYAPWMWLYTLTAFRKEKDPAQRGHNREIRRTLLSHSLLFGENLLLLAKKV